MTHIQKLFIQNLRYYRTKAGFSQLAFSEKINLSPNYLNAVENGKNFPSLEVIQNIADVLNLLPYQLFLETPDIIYIQSSEKINDASQEIIQAATELKQKLIVQIDTFIDKYTKQE